MAKEREQVYTLHKTPKTKDRTEDGQEDRCQWLGVHGKCQLRATAGSTWTEGGRTHWTYCGYHSTCARLRFHGNDFQSFVAWYSALPKQSSWRRYSPGCLYDLLSGKPVPVRYAEDYQPEDNDPGRMLPPSENQARLRALILKFGGR